MTRTNKRRVGRPKKSRRDAKDIFEHIHPEIKKNVWVVSLLGVAILFLLASAGQAGPVGSNMYQFLNKLFGWGYYLLPSVSFILAASFVSPEKKRAWSITIVGSLVFVMSGLGFLDIVRSGVGGLTGSLIGAVQGPFGTPASLVIMGTALLVSFLILLNRPLKITSLPVIFAPKTKNDDVLINIPEENSTMNKNDDKDESMLDEESGEQNTDDERETTDTIKEKHESKSVKSALGEIFSTPHHAGNYTAPPLSLLASKSDKPTIGDLRANANIIKRTLDSFGIIVEMGEIQVGPTVTRYTLKPAEGVKLSKITALHQDLALALAAHPIRIEAPIPGKSLVGIEVPNKSSALVRLGSLLAYPEFTKSGPLAFVLGRDVSGEPIFVNIAKMPHMLIAGATGSGKSITIHSLLISLLFKNSPETLQMILIDPKRVELSIYEDIPHLISPVITENKKAVGALKWAISEMERRYDLLLEAGARDIASYNKSGDEKLPYILIVIDELADLMASFSREVEGAIIRLAQMSRATGIHIIVSTQRPSVEVITGLIKANITSRIALQVASQVDSRTILDTSGAEKLLGNGDLLLISSESSKPKRIQGAYITESEIKGVVNFIKKNNEPLENGEIDMDQESGNKKELNLDAFYGDEEKDELYDEAVELVRKAGKGSASLLQRRLRVGYARAARLLDIMEENGIVGPADGSKPREIYIDSEDKNIDDDSDY